MLLLPAPQTNTGSHLPDITETQVLPQQMPNRNDYWHVYRKMWEETSELLSAGLHVCFPCHLHTLTFMFEGMSRKSTSSSGLAICCCSPLFIQIASRHPIHLAVLHFQHPILPHKYKVTCILYTLMQEHEVSGITVCGEKFMIDI